MNASAFASALIVAITTDRDSSPASHYLPDYWHGNVRARAVSDRIVELIDSGARTSRVVARWELDVDSGRDVWFLTYTRTASAATHVDALLDRVRGLKGGA